MNYAAVILDPAILSSVNSLQALIAQGHTIKRVFFYREGVLASQLPIASSWQQLANQHQLELICCSGSMQRRNLSLDSQSRFEIGGLGLLAECFIECDQVVQFG